ncbi:hypothetical protein PINS_up024204 [Pythium insidiosum]|nr:hypothetical protein PINS_up024204 [Pythium insidiosum]
MILRSLAEDCVSSCFNSTIPPARRKDILQGLNVCLPELFPVVYHELERQYATYQTDLSTRSQSKRLIHAALQMLREFLDWMPLDKPVEPSTNLIFVAVQLLGDDEFRVAAAECLDVYVSRTFGKENRRIMLQTIGQIVEKVVSLNLESLDPDLESNLLFHKKINDVLVTWGTTQLDVLLLDASAEEMALLMAILQCLCRLFAHPSLILTETQVVLWLNVLKHKVILHHPMTVEVVSKLREVCFEKYFKFSSPDRDDDTPPTQCSALEFDDNHEYTTFFGNFRGRLYALLRVIVQLDPTTSLKMLHERSSTIYKVHVTATDHLNHAGLSSELSTVFIYHEGLSSLIECVIKQLPPVGTRGPREYANHSGVVGVDPIIHIPRPVAEVSSDVCALRIPKYYALDGAILTSVFEILFANIDFVLPGEAVHGTMSNETMNVRRRALASLVSICQAIPSFILPVLPVLCQKVQDLFAQDRVLDSEGVSFVRDACSRL